MAALIAYENSLMVRGGRVRHITTCNRLEHSISFDRSEALIHYSPARIAERTLGGSDADSRLLRG